MLPLFITSTLMVLNKNLLKNKVLWGILLLSYGLHGYLHRYTIDNHKYLYIYWVAVCFLAVMSKDPKAFFRINARALIIITFFFATLWKVIAPEFMSGTFMKYTLIQDNRLSYIKSKVANLTEDEATADKNKNRLLRTYIDTEFTIKPIDRPGINWTANVLTYTAVVIEMLVFVAFSLYRFTFFMKIKDYLLLIFVLFTYQLLPVAPFGLLLSIMGIAQIDKNNKPLFAYYIIAFLLLLVASKITIVSLASTQLPQLFHLFF